MNLLAAILLSSFAAGLVAVWYVAPALTPLMWSKRATTWHCRSSMPPRSAGSLRRSPPSG